jgi:hypothetical protein
MRRDLLRYEGHLVRPRSMRCVDNCGCLLHTPGTNMEREIAYCSVQQSDKLEGGMMLMRRIAPLGRVMWEREVAGDSRAG